jgi:glutathione S-transferase
MSNEIFLYWGSGSTPCWRIQIVLEEKNVKYSQKMLSFEKNEHKSEEIMSLNPRGQVKSYIKN